MRKRKMTYLKCLNDVKTLKGFGISVGKEGTSIYREHKQTAGCSYISEKIFTIQKREDGKILLKLDMLSSEEAIIPTKVCDGLDIMYCFKKLYIRGYSETGETFLINQIGKVIDEYEDIPYIA